MASAATHYPHGDVHDDESILDDDVIDADDGEYGCWLSSFFRPNPALYMLYSD
jgi:hypothetical protein